MDSTETKATPPAAMPTAPPTDSGTEKARLECEKIRAEIENIRKPLLKTPAFYSAILPVALASLGFLFSWLSGWFEVQQTRIYNEKILVEAQTERLKSERTTLEAQAGEQRARYAQVEIEITALRTRESNLTNQVARLTRERDEMRLTKELVEGEVKRLAGSDEKASNFLKELQTIQGDRGRLSDELCAVQATNVTLLVTTAKLMVLLQQADSVLNEAWGIALKDSVNYPKYSNFLNDLFTFRAAAGPYYPAWRTDHDPVLDSFIERESRSLQEAIKPRASSDSKQMPPTGSKVGKTP